MIPSLYLVYCNPCSTIIVERFNIYLFIYWKGMGLFHSHYKWMLWKGLDHHGWCKTYQNFIANIITLVFFIFRNVNISLFFVFSKKIVCLFFTSCFLTTFFFCVHCDLLFIQRTEIVEKLFCLHHFAIVNSITWFFKFLISWTSSLHPILILVNHSQRIFIKPQTIVGMCLNLWLMCWPFKVIRFIVFMSCYWIKNLTIGLKHEGIIGKKIKIQNIGVWFMWALR
jgi:hypothetical protein